MENLHHIKKQLLMKACKVMEKCTKKTQNMISSFSNEKLISMIGMEMHCFYYPEDNQVRSSDFLENLIWEAERRNLSYSENVKGAKTFLEELKNQHKETTNEDVVVPVTSTNHFFEMAKCRKSIRKFSERKISKETIYQILNCAIESPSSCNRQSWRFLIINDSESLSFISKIRRIAFLKNAPVVICVLIDKNLYADKKELDYTSYMDGAAAIMNIIYAAESLGISSCWVNFGILEISENDMIKFYSFFKVNTSLKPISLVVLGYGVQDINKPKRELIDYYIIGAKT